MFDTGQDYNLLAMDAIDPNDIATLLKLYLRERELQPLILFQLLFSWILKKESWIGTQKGGKKDFECFVVC